MCTDQTNGLDRVSLAIDFAQDADVSHGWQRVLESIVTSTICLASLPAMEDHGCASALRKGKLTGLRCAPADLGLCRSAEHCAGGLGAVASDRHDRPAGFDESVDHYAGSHRVNGDDADHVCLGLEKALQDDVSLRHAIMQEWEDR